MLDAESLSKGKDYSEMRESYVIFITEDDFFNKGLAVYHVERRIEELNNACFNDGSHIIYVNSQYQKNDNFGRLMKDFYQTDADKIYYKPLADRVRYFKEDSEGVMKMCKISEDLINEGKAEIIAKMISNGLSYEEISQYIGLSVEEIKELVEILSVH